MFLRHWCTVYVNRVRKVSVKKNIYASPLASLRIVRSVHVIDVIETESITRAANVSSTWWHLYNTSGCVSTRHRSFDRSGKSTIRGRLYRAKYDIMQINVENKKKQRLLITTGALTWWRRAPMQCITSTYNILMRHCN